MARKSQETPVESSESLITSLIDGTHFNFIGSNGEVGRGSLSDKPLVETPLHAVNCLIGGGLPLGAMIEVFGPSASGKSSVMYETLGNFQKQYPEGVAFIIDSESSTDDSRLRQLGVDPLRAPRMGAATLEDGFEQIIKILNKMTGDPRYKDFPVLILWDTIAACPTRAQSKEGNMYAGGMAERARILKSSLTTIFPLLEKQNVLLVLLNQVMAEIGGWRPGVTTAGGNALKHDVHLKFELKGGKTEYDGVFPIYKYSTLSVPKSKISPIMSDFPIILDITKGGLVDRGGSLAWWICNLTTPAIFKQGSWWSVEDWVYEKYQKVWDKFPSLSGKFRQSSVYELSRSDDNFIDFLQLIWIDLISERYVLQRDVCKNFRDKILVRLSSSLGLSIEDVYPTDIKEETALSEESSNDLVSDLESLYSSTETEENS